MQSYIFSDYVTKAKTRRTMLEKQIQWKSVKTYHWTIHCHCKNTDLLLGSKWLIILILTSLSGSDRWADHRSSCYLPNTKPFHQSVLLNVKSHIFHICLYLRRSGDEPIYIKRTETWEVGGITWFIPSTRNAATSQSITRSTCKLSL